ncbi:MAG: retropepsin-like aspartic protease [Candidatus Omnitrophota bacterium]
MFFIRPGGNILTGVCKHSLFIFFEMKKNKRGKQSGKQILRRASLAALVICLFGQYSAAAQKQEQKPVTVVLKTQGQIEGFLIEETADKIILDVGFGTVALYKGEIEKIEAPEGEGKNLLLRQVMSRKEEVRRNRGEQKENEREVQKRIQDNLKEKEADLSRHTAEKEHKIKIPEKAKITVDAVVNGSVKIPLVVDTGATVVLISIEDAVRLYGWQVKAAEKVSVTLADGTERKGIPLVLGSVRVGRAEAKDVRAVTMDLNGQPGLLGMSFLDRFSMKVDPARGELILKEKK